MGLDLVRLARIGDLCNANEEGGGIGGVLPVPSSVGLILLRFCIFDPSGGRVSRLGLALTSGYLVNLLAG